VKRGLYEENVVMKKSGTLNNKIVFIGYNTTFGDLFDSSGMPWEYADIDPSSYGALNATHAEDGSAIKDMPQIHGGGVTGGTRGVDFNGKSYIEMHNFEVLNCTHG
jgi:hypothetical protein